MNVYGLLLFWLDDRAQTSNKLKWLLFLYIVLPFLYINIVYIKPEILNAPSLKSPVLSDMYDAPELMFKYNIDSVGAPYHTNIEGIKDNHTLWFTTNENELLTLIKKHNIRSIYLASAPSEVYVNPEENTDKLYGKIITGQKLYPWLIKIGNGHYEIDWQLLK